MIKTYGVTNYSADIIEGFETLDGKYVCVVGILATKRTMGKASFCDILDLKGRIQCYVRRELIGADSYADFKRWDIGDIISVTGEVFRTQKSEISVCASSIELLCKIYLDAFNQV